MQEPTLDTTPPFFEDGEFSSMKVFSEKELVQYNWKGGAPAYVAFNGRVYDVPKSFTWKDGKHQALHRAGEDLTDTLKKASHDAKDSKFKFSKSSCSISPSQERIWKRFWRERLMSK